MRVSVPARSLRAVLAMVGAGALLAACQKQEDALVVHYYRYGGDYEGWNMWYWPSNPNGDGAAAEFGKPDKDGYVTARGRAVTGVKEFGMIVRKSVEGNEWAQKDGESDRFAAPGEVWLRQGDDAVYHQKPAEDRPPVLFAAADSADKVTGYLLKKPAGYGHFAVYEDGVKRAGKAGRGGADNELVITLEQPLTDVTRLYTLEDESGEFAGKPVTMRRILDSYVYGENDLGLTYSAAKSVFKVWSPAARTAELVLYDSAGTYGADGKVQDNSGGQRLGMERDAVTGVRSVTAEGDLAGKFYLYHFTFADGKETYAVDPYARAVSLNGERAAIIDMAAASPAGWKQMPRPPAAASTAAPSASAAGTGTASPSASAASAAAGVNAVLYEAHVRDFSVSADSGMKYKGKFLAFTERGTRGPDGQSTGVDHLVRLGITHIHLLPAFDFASVDERAGNPHFFASQKNAAQIFAPQEFAYNWGYDPLNYNVPEGSYSTDPADPSCRVREFKMMVKALHEAGIRVVMDVVFNHTYAVGAGPFDAVVPGYYYRTFPDGRLANGSGCGNEVASERPMVRKFIVDSCLYWLDEYNVDGFRFDLMGLIDTPTMNAVVSACRKARGEGVIIYGEPWQAGGSVLPDGQQTVTGRQRGLGFAVFNDHIRGSIKGGSDDGSRGFATSAPGTERGITLGVRGSVDDITERADESINYVTAHDNLNLWDKIASSYETPDLAGAPYGLIDESKPLFQNNTVRSALLANAIIFTSQGIPFFQAGDEFLRTKFGDANSYRSSDEINMIRWQNAARFSAVTEYYAGLIRLRKEHPAFRMASREDMNRVKILSAENLLVVFVIEGGAAGDRWPVILTAYNGGAADAPYTLPEGRWEQVVDDTAAGVRALRTAEGGIVIPRLSAAVFHQ